MLEKEKFSLIRVSFGPLSVVNSIEKNGREVDQYKLYATFGIICQKVTYLKESLVATNFQVLHKIFGKYNKGGYFT